MTKGLHKDSLRKVDNPHQWMIDDARMELIQQIKAEVERLYDGEAPAHDQQCDFDDGYFTGIDAISKFLDTLQEQPVCEGLKEETERFMSNLTEKKGVFPPLTRLGFKAIARHFAKWGAEHLKK